MKSIDGIVSHYSKELSFQEEVSSSQAYSPSSGYGTGAVHFQLVSSLMVQLGGCGG